MSHRRLHLGLPALVLLVAACSDGERDSGPAGSGSDDVADSDGDGLEDRAEGELGTDPSSVDTDGDSYWDPWELAEGTDPTSDASRIYEGRWPYNPNKDELTGAFDGATLIDGDVVGDHIGWDQFGERVHLWDFLGQGKDVILYAAAQWSRPDQDAARWLSTGGEGDAYEALFGELREAVDDGRVLWVTVIVENNSGADSTTTTVAEWDADFPHERIAVLTDEGDNILNGVIFATGYFPSAMLLNQNGTIQSLGRVDTIMSSAQDRL